jgi:virginiamycin B lyase
MACTLLQAIDPPCGEDAVVNATTITISRQFGRWQGWVLAAILVAAGLGALGWHFRARSDPGFVEYPMPVKTDIPAAVAAAPNGTVWFTIEFSDAIGVFRDSKIERFRKEGQNLEPLGLAVDAGGGAWFTDTPMRAISHISPDGSIRSFPLSTPIVRLGRLAVAPDGAVWFADITTASVTRLQDGRFTRYDVGSLGATPYGMAVDADGSVWTTLQGAEQLGLISSGGRVTALDIPTRNSGLSDLAVDRSGAVWLLEMRANQLTRFADGRFTEFAIPTPSAGLTAIAAAPDGAVWFTEISAGKLGRLRDGRISEVPLPRANARPFAVTVDSINNVWYTDLSGSLGMLPATAATGR